MRTAGLPTFTKLWARNDNDKLLKGTYQISVNMSMCHDNYKFVCPSDTVYEDYPVRPFKGTKSIVISTVSWMGGKNPFLGWAYVAAAALFVLLGAAGLIRHLVKPRYFMTCLFLDVFQTYITLFHRRLGDMSLLSWNR